MHRLICEQLNNEKPADIPRAFLPRTTALAKPMPVRLYGLKTFDMNEGLRDAANSNA
jgi:hypothetical protein